MRSVCKRVQSVAFLIVLLTGDLRVAFANYAPSIHAQDDIKALKTCLTAFKAVHGRLPTKEEGLQALVTNPDPAKFQKWLKLMDKVPVDPWGHDYQYIPSALEDIRDYGIYSFGKDGISNSNGNDPDDFNSWDTGRKHLGTRPRQRNLIACTAIVGACVVGSLTWHPAHGRRAEHPH